MAWDNLEEAWDGDLTGADAELLLTFKEGVMLRRFLDDLEDLGLADGQSLAHWRRFWLRARRLWLNRAETRTYQERELQFRLANQQGNAPELGSGAEAAVDEDRALAWHDEWLEWLSSGLDLALQFPGTGQSNYLSRAICSLAKEVVHPSEADSLPMDRRRLLFGLNRMEPTSQNVRRKVSVWRRNVRDEIELLEFCASGRS